METDIRIIKLYRKALGDTNGESSDKANQESYFATDYFDVMDVVKKELGDGLVAIMGLESDGNDENRGTAMQSYTLYCSEEMISSFEGNENYLGDPFNNDDQEMPFLSVIQVHITPEALKRVAFGEDELWKWTEGGDDGIILEPFVTNLYDLLKDYAGKCPAHKFISRVYHVLSAGDFAVVVRSAQASTSYDISTLIRKQTLIADKYWVIYKTYTLLTMRRYILPDFTDGSGLQGNKFVIRGCYSNKYWSEQEKIRKELAERGLHHIDGLYRLNGRYDFSIRIAEKEFVYLFPRIIQYKRDIQRSGFHKQVDQEPTGSGSAILYLRYLMDNNYLSYINERYLLEDSNLDRDNLPASNVIANLRVDQNKENSEEIKTQITEEIKKLREKHEELTKKLEGFKRYRSNAQQYMQLLGKQIKLCCSINELSDTRIYARVLTEQLESVLSSAEIYLELAKEEADPYTIWNLTEDYLAEAVYIVDHYAQYIRNNNLQSLQTPNYNIESSMGMEKILIGYSEYLYKFVKLYKNCRILKEGDDIKNLLPVVVPDIRHVGVYVEVLFPEGNGSSWIKEREIIQKYKQKNDYAFLTSVGCPTFTQLVDIPSMFTTLFHEVAHQIRYERREQRNDSLLRAAIAKCISETASNINRYLNQRAKTTVDLYALIETTAGALTDAIIQVFFKAEQGAEYSYFYRDAPLNSFAYELFSQIENIVLKLQYSINWQQELNNFLHEVLFDNSWDDAEFLEIVSIMAENWNKLLRVSPLEESFESIVDNIEKKEIKCAFILALLGVCNVLEKNERAVVMDKVSILKDVDKRKRWINGEEGAVSKGGLEELWNEALKGVEAPAISKNFLAYYRFCMWLDNDIRLSCDVSNDKDQLDKVYDRMYHMSCEKWREYEKKSKCMYLGCEENDANLEVDYEIPSFTRWIEIGRGLGIDNETDENLKKFTRIIAMAVESCRNQASKLILKYREETSDIFMCSIIDLTPFGYVNLMAVNLPMDEIFEDACYDDVYIERISHVIYEKWCGGSQSHKSQTRYRNYCRKILKNLVSYCEPCVKPGEADDAHITAARKKLKEALEAFCSLRWPNNRETVKTKLFLTIDQAIESLRELWDVIVQEELKDAGSKKNGREKNCQDQNKNAQDHKRQRKILENAGRICRITEGLIDRGMIYIDKLKEDKELEADYARGVKNLRALREGKMNSADGGFMCSLIRLNKDTADYFNAETDQSIVFQNLTKTGLEFLLRMFYNNKIRNAKK